MHSCETLAPQPASGPNLLLELGRLIIRSRSISPTRAVDTRDRLLQAKLLAAKPSTSQQVQTQPRPNKDPKPGVEAQLDSHVRALWDEQIPVCIDVLLAPDCPECYASMTRQDEEVAYDKLHSHQKGLLLERWTMQALVNKSHESPTFSSCQWLLNAVRSQLHFSQLAAWRATLRHPAPADTSNERRRKLSREKCNFKKLEANCDEQELPQEQQRTLNIVYSVKIPGESYNMSEFLRSPVDHQFPITDIGNNIHLKVLLESLPRIDEIPNVKCNCQKRRSSKEVHEDLVGKLNDLSIDNKCETINANIGTPCRRLAIVPNTGATEYVYIEKEVVDDRMLTPCSENGKHKCSCDEESDGKEKKRLDDRRLKEIAKCKRKLRKEGRLKKQEDDRNKETHTSIPILQAARFDRFRAIGCYRNQTYLTLPASRIETKSPFVETDCVQYEDKKTNSIGTQTDDVSCPCGNAINMKCENCRMVRSEATYNLASLENGSKNEDEKNMKKHKCDIKCDNIIKRPKLQRLLPVVDKIDKVMADRQSKDIEELHLNRDDTVFSTPKENKRQKTFSITEEYVLYEKCDYGTIDKCEVESPSEEYTPATFSYPESVEGSPVKLDPECGGVDKFRWRFDSATSLVFHSKTGLPLTSSPAPLRRTNNCFDYDATINGVSGVKSALFQPVSPPPAAPVHSPSPGPVPVCSPSSGPVPGPVPVPTPRVSPPTSPVTPKKTEKHKLKMGPSRALLGSFEESALQGRLEPVATVRGFSAELGASGVGAGGSAGNTGGAWCPPHRRLPVTVTFYAPGGTNAPYMGHIALGAGGYRVARAGSIQVSLFNPHGTLVKMFVVRYDLGAMPPRARTFLRQRTLLVQPGARTAPPLALRYLIHLRFMTSKSGKMYLHSDIRMLVSRKADLDTATAHSIFKPIATDKDNSNRSQNTNSKECNGNHDNGILNGTENPKNPECEPKVAERGPNRVFGGCGDYTRDIGYENQNGAAYELRSFTYAPDNPRYSPR